MTRRDPDSETAPDSGARLRHVLAKSRPPGSPRRRAEIPEETEDWLDTDPETGVGDGPETGADAPSDLLTRVKTFTRSHLGAVILLALIVATAAVVQITRARSTEIEAAPSPAVSLSIAEPSAQVSSVAPAIRVHVIGAVVRPGVVTVADGGRVIDAIDAAGGLAAHAQLGELNLAAKVVDGSQVVVGDGGTTSEVRSGGARGASAAPAATEAGVDPSAASAKLDLNTATAEQLEAVPGVGPVTAKAIIAWRTQHGRFSKVAELQEVDGIGPKKFAQIESYVSV